MKAVFEEIADHQTELGGLFIGLVNGMDFELIPDLLHLQNELPESPTTNDRDLYLVYAHDLEPPLF